MAYDDLLAVKNNIMVKIQEHFQGSYTNVNTFFYKNIKKKTPAKNSKQDNVGSYFDKVKVTGNIIRYKFWHLTFYQQLKII